MKKAISFVVLAALSLPLAAASEAAPVTAKLVRKGGNASPDRALKQALNKLDGANPSVSDTVLKIATQAAAKGILNSTSVAYMTGFGAIDLFNKLFARGYMPAFDTAIRTGIQGIESTYEDVRRFSLDLFTELVKAKFQPAFEPAAQAAKKSISDPKKQVQEAGIKLCKELVNTTSNRTEIFILRARL